MARVASSIQPRPCAAFVASFMLLPYVSFETHACCAREGGDNEPTRNSFDPTETSMGEAYIVAAARTAGGKKGGKLKDWHPVDLGAKVIDSLLDRSGADPASVEDVVCGCVMQVGQ